MSDKRVYRYGDNCRVLGCPGRYLWRSLRDGYSSFHMEGAFLECSVCPDQPEHFFVPGEGIARSDDESGGKPVAAENPTPDEIWKALRQVAGRG